ncbi:tetratricopeptide repeat protein [Pedobacter puniceum]|uniref:tetratricopeptide repeat protein n=1 Tax=Pedobacter puniceum TaxID=2666136 RepID=UPI0012B0BE66|nr:tetratricopeptide repeat protein [Pedobacter puniceum]
MKFKILAVLALILPLTILAQTPFERLGQKAMMNGDFNTAATFFEQAVKQDHGNMNALYLLGYAYYHSSNYKKSIESFDKLIAYKPSEAIAYYYRGKAKMLMSAQIKDYKNPEKEDLLLGAIKDFSSGIELTPNDMKFYQNRGLAYQEYSVFKSQKVNDIYNKNAAISAANSSITDLKKVLAENAARKDIVSQIEKSKQLLINIKN